jgi:hypothetical protein
MTVAANSRPQVTDERLAEAIRAADPYRDIVIPEPTVTAAQLRARAESEASERHWYQFLQSHATRRGVIVAASLAIGAAVTAYVFRAAPAIAAPGPLDIDFALPPTPARDWLLSLAQSLPSQAVCGAVEFAGSRLSNHVRALPALEHGHHQPRDRVGGPGRPGVVEGGPIGR